jgi:VanZ family protein
MAPRQNRLSHPAVAKIVLAGYVLVLLTATHLPPTVSLLLPEEDNLDKLYHFTAYSILAGFLATAWQFASGVLTGRHLRWVWFAVAIFAALDEITQIPVGRDCDFWDWTADVIGAATGLLVFAWLRRRITERTTQAQ